MPNSEKKSHRYNLQNTVKTVSNEDDIVVLVKKAHREQQNIRVIGSRNSAQVYRIAPSNANSFVQIELEDNYDNVLNIDQENKRITIQSGMRQGKLISILKKYQWALNSINGSHLITVGGAIATGSFSASKFSYGDAILSLRIIEADGNIITVNRNHCNFGAYLCSNGLLGVISEITLQCVEEYSVRGKSSIVDFETMISLRDEDNLHFLEDWDYMICEWYPYIKKVVCRRSAQIPKLKSNESNEISSVGPSESYFGQLLTIIGGVFLLTNKVVISSYLKYLGTEFGDGFWGDRICADPKLSSTFHPIDYLEVVIPHRHYVAYMTDLREYYEKHPERMPYGPVISDWIISDKHSWIGKNSHDKDEWFAAITFMRQQVEKKTAAYIFEGPVALAKKYDTRMHWGKNPWMDKKEDVAKTLPKGNLERFSKLRKEKDPQGLFLNDFFKKVFL
ncbi:MAG: FAD-binding protein [Aureispira sp.]|nr:FAD-binding protein [Aureispira sp.]